MTRDTINQPESKTHMAEDSARTPPRVFPASTAGNPFPTQHAAYTALKEAVNEALELEFPIIQIHTHAAAAAIGIVGMYQKMHAAPAPAEDPNPGDIGLSPEVLADIGKPPTVTDSDSHASRVLYPAIKAAMADLAGIHEGFSMDVNRAYNRLFCAFWSEVPAPASAGGLRNEIAPNEPPSEPTTCRASIAQHGYGPREETLDYSSTDGALLKAHSPESAAMRTLRALGYEHTGGVEWRPPYGPAPVFAEDVRAGIDCIESVLDSRADEPGERFQIVQMPLSDWRPVLAALKGKVVRELITVEQAVVALKLGLQGDDELAWGWHSNIAMPIMDALQCSHDDANRAAARLMRHLFDVDMEKHPQYADLMEGADPAPTAEESLAPELVTMAAVRPVIAYPARAVSFHLTHDSLGSKEFHPLVAVALREMADHEERVEGHSYAFDVIEGRADPARWPFTASNGVRVECEPWKTVDREDYPEAFGDALLDGQHPTTTADANMADVADAPLDFDNIDWSKLANATDRRRAYGMSKITGAGRENQHKRLCEDAKATDEVTIDRLTPRTLMSVDDPVGVARWRESLKRQDQEMGHFASKLGGTLTTSEPVNHAADTLAAVVDLGDTPAGAVPTAHLTGELHIKGATVTRNYPLHVTPTVGRVMHYFPAVGTAEAGFHQHPGGGPYAAIVAEVRDHGDRVNISVLDHLGVPHARQWVLVWQQGMRTPDGEYVCWPARKDGGA